LAFAYIALLVQCSHLSEMEYRAMVTRHGVVAAAALSAGPVPRKPKAKKKEKINPALIQLSPEVDKEWAAKKATAIGQLPSGRNKSSLVETCIELAGGRLRLTLKDQARPHNVGKQSRSSGGSTGSFRSYKGVNIYLFVPPDKWQYRLVTGNA
jgi:hypothetical protein